MNMYIYRRVRDYSHLLSFEVEPCFQLPCSAIRNRGLRLQLRKPMDFVGPLLLDQIECYVYPFESCNHYHSIRLRRQLTSLKETARPVRSTCPKGFAP